MPVFNTLFHSEKILSELAYAALMPVFIANEKNHGRESKLPEDIDQLLLGLKHLPSSLFSASQVSEWETAFNLFMRQASLYLTPAEELINIMAPPPPPSPFLQSDRRNETFSNSLRLLHAISVKRFEWKQNLALYLETVNHFIREKNTPVPRSDERLEAPLAELIRKLQPKVASAMFPIYRCSQTVARAKDAVQTTDARKGKSKAAAAACDLMQSKTQLVQSYGAAQASVETRMKEAANFEWLKNCIHKFPKHDFTLTDCLRIKMENQTHKFGQEFSDEVTKKVAAAVAESKELPQAVNFHADIQVAPWLYDFANVHFIAQNEIAGYQLLIAMFDARSNAVKRAASFYSILQRNFKKQRPLDAKESECAYKFELDALKLKQAHQEKSSAGVTLFHMSEMFEDDRKQLFLLVRAFLNNTRDLLKEQLTNGADSDDAWLTHVLSPLYGDRLVYRADPRIKCPINREHLMRQLLALVNKMHLLYELVTQLKECDAGGPSCTDGVIRLPRYQVLVNAANGILYGYYQVKHPADLKLNMAEKTYPQLNSDKFFTPTIRAILNLLYGPESIETAVGVLAQRNVESPPCYKIETFLKQFVRVLSDYVYGPLNEEVDVILNRIGLLAKRYLPQISGI